MTIMNVAKAQRLGQFVGGITSVATTIGGFSTVKALTLGAATPVVFGAMLGVMFVQSRTNDLNKKIFQSYGSYTTKRLCCHFALQASSFTLGSLLGLALTSAFISIAANPFTMPALIAGGISAAVILALYSATHFSAVRRYDDYTARGAYDHRMGHHSPDQRRTNLNWLTTQANTGNRLTDAEEYRSSDDDLISTPSAFKLRRS